MQAAFIVSFLANLALIVASLFILPERVAIHFGAGGMANGWASKGDNTFMMIALHSFLFCSLYFSPFLVSRVPARWVSLPNRDYWLSPPRRSLAIEMISNYMWQMGTALFLLLFVAGLLTIRANLSHPVRLDEGPFFFALLLYLGYTGYWLIALFRAFRIPRKR